MPSTVKTAHSQCQPTFSFTVVSRVDAKSTLNKKPARELGRVNRHGDTYRQNKVGQVTHYRFRHSDKSFSFGYDASGSVSTINSSDGWSWTRMQEPDFNGWLVRNYFDSWRVAASDCESVNVTADGVQSNGKNTLLMGLPVRS